MDGGYDEDKGVASKNRKVSKGLQNASIQNSEVFE